MSGVQTPKIAHHTDPRILLVEDEMDLAKLIFEILSTLPARVSVAKNGREAIRIIESDQSFDLVLLDLVLPQLSGIYVLRRFRQISTSTKGTRSYGTVASQ